jgi:hypothetical protein
VLDVSEVLVLHRTSAHTLGYGTSVYLLHVPFHALVVAAGAATRAPAPVTRRRVESALHSRGAASAFDGAVTATAESFIGWAREVLGLEARDVRRERRLLECTVAALAVGVASPAQRLLLPRRGAGVTARLAHLHDVLESFDATRWPVVGGHAASLLVLADAGAARAGAPAPYLAVVRDDARGFVRDVQGGGMPGAVMASVGAPGTVATLVRAS